MWPARLCATKPLPTNWQRYQEGILKTPSTHPKDVVSCHHRLIHPSTAPEPVPTHYPNQAKDQHPQCGSRANVQQTAQNLLAVNHRLPLTHHKNWCKHAWQAQPLQNNPSQVMSMTSSSTALGDHNHLQQFPTQEGYRQLNRTI